MQTLRRLRRLVILFSPFLLTGCATGIGVTDSACMSFRPIHGSIKDTLPTKRQIVAHNAVYDTLCN